MNSAATHRETQPLPRNIRSLYTLIAAIILTAAACFLLATS